MFLLPLVDLAFISHRHILFLTFVVTDFVSLQCWWTLSILCTLRLHLRTASSEPSTHHHTHTAISGIGELFMVSGSLFDILQHERNYKGCLSDSICSWLCRIIPLEKSTYSASWYWGIQVNGQRELQWGNCCPPVELSWSPPLLFFSACHPSCLMCAGKTPHSCTVCGSARVLLAGRCLSQCPETHFNLEGTCTGECVPCWGRSRVPVRTFALPSATRHLLKDFILAVLWLGSKILFSHSTVERYHVMRTRGINLPMRKNN